MSEDVQSPNGEVVEVCAARVPKHDAATRAKWRTAKKESLARQKAAELSPAERVADREKRQRAIWAEARQSLSDEEKAFTASEIEDQQEIEFFMTNIADWETDLENKPYGRQFLNQLKEESQSAKELICLNLVLVEPRELQHQRRSSFSRSRCIRSARGVG